MFFSSSPRLEFNPSHHVLIHPRRSLWLKHLLPESSISLHIILSLLLFLPLPFYLSSNLFHPTIYHHLIASSMALRLIFACLALLSAVTVAQTDNANECSCFRTNGSSAGYFINHRFHDFRNIADTASQVPALIQNASGTTNAPATSDFLASDIFAVDWQTQSWNNTDTLGTGVTDATVLMINSQNNVYIGMFSPPSYGFL